MKKFIVSAICAAVALCTIPFAACESESNSGLINLADCEIGYELPVYPDCEFDYKVSDDCTVHISEIKAVLTAKNEINEGDVVEDKFYPYEITIYAEGTSALSQNSIAYLYIYLSPSGKGAYGDKATVDNRGNLYWEFSIDVIADYSVYFQRIDVSNY